MVFVGENDITGDAFAAQSSTTIACAFVATADEHGYRRHRNIPFADFGPVAGTGSGVAMHSGDFDNGYYSNSGAGTVSGYMYVCAIDPNGASGGGNTALRQIAFDANGVVTTVSAEFLPVATNP